MASRCLLSLPHHNVPDTVLSLHRGFVTPELLCNLIRMNVRLDDLLCGCRRVEITL